MHAGCVARVRGVCKRRASRISSGVFIPRRRINTGGAVAVTKQRRGDSARAWLASCSSLWDAVNPNGRRVDVAFGVRVALRAALSFYTAPVRSLASKVRRISWWLIPNIAIRFGESDAQISLSDEEASP